MNDFFKDFLTVVWKECREVRAERRLGLWGRLALWVLLAGIVIPWQLRVEWRHSMLAGMVALWMAFYGVSTGIASTVAGERERQTWNALRASPLSDAAIVWGKVVTSVGMTWPVVLVSAAVGLIWTDLLQSAWGYYWAPTLVVIIAGSLLSAIFAAAGGFTLSLQSASVRQAQQLLSIISLALVFGPAVLAKILLPSVVAWEGRIPHAWSTLAIGLGILLALDGAALGVAVGCLRRDRAGPSAKRSRRD